MLVISVDTSCVNKRRVYRSAPMRIASTREDQGRMLICKGQEVEDDGRRELGQKLGAS